MCGIVGYIGKKNPTDKLINGLKKLEYRGYDSAGVAVRNNSGNVEVIREVGKVANLEKKVNEHAKEFEFMGIAHTRWATHGAPEVRNAHPHTQGNVTLVHNGIIENYVEIKNELKEHGVIFNSDTDTEVACAYINYVYQQEKDKLKCIKTACDKFRGSYAFVIIFDDNMDELYATRFGSPLVVGVSEGENYISSDVSAFLNDTNKFILLDNREYVRLTAEKVEVYNDELMIQDKKIEVATWSSEQYEKGGYDHFMLKEIHEQPEVVKEIVNRYIDGQISFKKYDLKKFNNIHIVACGSAMHAGLIGKRLIEEYVEVPVVVDVASEYRYNKQIINEKTLVIIISQSGETADTLAALRLAKEKNATIVSIVNVIGSTIARESAEVIYTMAGPEIAVATTKGYLSQVLVLSLMAFDMVRKSMSSEEENRILEELKNVDQYILDIINDTTQYADVAKDIYERNDIFYIGRGIDFSMGMEATLKLKEISYIHCEAYAAGELKHGTISLIDKGTPVICINTNSAVSEKTISNIKECRARGAKIVYIATKELDSTDSFYDKKIILPNASDFTKTLLVTPVCQLIAYFTAKYRGCDIDKPKNLAKSVTVE